MFDLHCIYVTWQSSDTKRLALGQMKAGKSPCKHLAHPLPTLQCSFHTSITVSMSQQHREGNRFLSFLFFPIILHVKPIKHHFRFESVTIFTITVMMTLFQDDSFQCAANLWLSLLLCSILTAFNPSLLSLRSTAEEGPHC